MFRLFLIGYMLYLGLQLSHSISGEGDFYLKNFKRSDRPRVHMRLATSWGQHPLLGQLYFRSLGSQVEATLCISGIRLQHSLGCGWIDPTEDPRNKKLRFGEVSFDPRGVDLGEVFIPAGSYQLIQLDLGRHCSGTTLRIRNQHGIFETDENITLTFSGDFKAVHEKESLILQTEKVISSLERVAISSDLKSYAESIDGAF